MINPMNRQSSSWHPNSANGWLGLMRPSPSKFGVRRLEMKAFRPPAAQVNTAPQPWQKRVAKPHAHWNARREAREARRSLSAA